jgi:hypothetical protein
VSVRQQEQHVQIACIDIEEVTGMAMSQRQSSNCKEMDIVG